VLFSALILYSGPPLGTGQSYSTYPLTTPIATSYRTISGTSTLSYTGIISGVQAATTGVLSGLVQYCSYAYGEFVLSGSRWIGLSIATDSPLLFIVMSADQFAEFPGLWVNACGFVQGGALMVRTIDAGVTYNSTWVAPSSGVYYWAFLNTQSSDAHYSLSYWSATSQITMSVMMQTLTSEERIAQTVSEKKSESSFTSSTSFSSYPTIGTWTILFVLVAAIVAISLTLMKRRSMGQKPSA